MSTARVAASIATARRLEKVAYRPKGIQRSQGKGGKADDLGRELDNGKEFSKSHGARIRKIGEPVDGIAAG